MNNDYNRRLRHSSRVLRNFSVSKAGRFLWKQILIRKQLGVGFKRQRPIGPYIVDFFSSEVGLIVEIDGNSHHAKAANDSTRQKWLEKQGFNVIRFSECDVLNDYGFVKEQLVHAVYCLKSDL